MPVSLQDVLDSARTTQAAVQVEDEKGKREIWVPARPISLAKVSWIQRIKDAWGVFTGKYDALEWPYQ